MSFQGSFFFPTFPFARLPPLVIPHSLPLFPPPPPQTPPPPPFSLTLLRHRLRCLCGQPFSIPNHCQAATWDLPLCLPMNTASLHSISRLVSIGPRIYMIGRNSMLRIASALEEYDPENDTWLVVAYSQRRRYGCIGAAVDGVFYVIGGLKMGRACGDGVWRVNRLS
ncbi:putative Cyclin B1 [Hibiscus syriacus]|uniref:Cyclin B1 n=1 Tax=Hibiscus syriacus TaxID=106335 RepID=A0A6A3BP84_HIBSY|nr:putative Cyclin B1 [Hibiscus syriacus]